MRTSSWIMPLAVMCLFLFVIGQALKEVEAAVVDGVVDGVGSSGLPVLEPLLEANEGNQTPPPPAVTEALLPEVPPGPDAGGSPPPCQTLP